MRKSSSSSRRNFLKFAVLTGLAPTGGSAPLHARTATDLSGRRLKLSMAAYSFLPLFREKKLTMADFIDYCAELNLEGTELTSYWFDAPDPRDPRTVDDAYLYQLKLQCFKLGLDISGTSIGNNFVQKDAAARRKEVEDVKIWCDKAAVLGAPVIRIFGGSRFPEGITEQQVFAWVIPALQECVAYAATRGVVLALENHGGFPQTAEQTIRLLTAVDSPWLGVTLDTGNFEDRWYEQIAALVPHASTVQIKPYQWSTAEPRRKIAADPDRIIRLLRYGGYRGYVVLEYEGDEDRYAVIPQWITKLRALTS